LRFQDAAFFEATSPPIRAAHGSDIQQSSRMIALGMIDCNRIYRRGKRAPRYFRDEDAVVSLSSPKPAPAGHYGRRQITET
jgi:hypothetical protein